MSIESLRNYFNETKRGLKPSVIGKEAKDLMFEHEINRKGYNEAWSQSWRDRSKKFLEEQAKASQIAKDFKKLARKVLKDQPVFVNGVLSGHRLVCQTLKFSGNKKDKCGKEYNLLEMLIDQLVIKETEREIAMQWKTRKLALQITCTCGTPYIISNQPAVTNILSGAMSVPKP